MKYLFSILLILLIACNKEKNSEPIPIFRFKANGVQYDWSGVLQVDSIRGSKGTVIARYYSNGLAAGYKIYGGDLKNNGANRISMDILRGSDSLRSINYFYRSQNTDSKLTEIIIGTWEPNDEKGYINGLYTDSVSISFISIQNSLAKGTF